MPLDRVVKGSGARESPWATGGGRRNNVEKLFCFEIFEKFQKYGK